MSRRRLDLRSATVLAVGALLLLPAAARGHEGLRRAEPGAGDTLSIAPTELRLTFFGSVEAELSAVRLVGPDGPVSLGPPRHPNGSRQVLVAAIEGPLATGEYTVHWRIVGADGHPVSGDFRFAIEEGAAGVASAPAAREPRPPRAPAGEDMAVDARFDAQSALYVLVRWVNFLALVAVLGAVAFRWAVVPLAAARRPERGLISRGELAQRAALLGLVAAGVLLAASLTRLAAQTVAVQGGGFDVQLLGTLLTGTAWGWGWLLQAAGALLAVTGFTLARAERAGGWAATLVAALALGLAPALSGHAVAAERLAPWPVLIDSLHVLSAGGWIGGLLAVLLVGVPLGSRSRGELSDLVQAFSFTALGFATVLVLSGVFSAWLHLPSLAELWESPYGRVLLIKVLLVLPILVAGAYNHLRVRPAMREPGGAATLRKSVRWELILSVAVLLATAILVATPPPSDARAASLTQSEAGENR